MTFVVGSHHSTITPVSQCLYVCARTKRNSTGCLSGLLCRWCCCCHDCQHSFSSRYRIY